MGKGWIWTAAVAAAVGIGAGTAGGAALRGGENALPAGLTVGGLSVGGLRADEAVAAIRGRIAALEAIRVAPDTLRAATAGGRSEPRTADWKPGAGTGAGGDAGAEAGGGAEADAAAAGAASPIGVAGAAKAVTLAELGLAIEADDAIAALESFGEAKWWQRSAAKKTLKPSYGIAVSWDEERLRAASETAWAGLASSPSRDASRTIDASDRIVYAAERLGTAVDMERLRGEVRELAPTSLAAAPEGGGGAEDGGSGGGPAGEPGGAGRTVAVELPVRQVPPAVTVDSLKDEGLSRKIAEFSTSFATSGDGRSHNVTVTAEALDGTLLQPGEEFSYGAIVAKAEKQYGYREAPVILNGKLTPGVGGGICQVSSTLYNALIRVSGIDIVERRNHSLPVHYLPAGLDATFADGYIDFRFRNATGKQLLIKAVVQNKTLTVKLFGTMDESVSYEIETVQKKVIAPKTVFVADAKLQPGASATVQRGEDGFVIESYRVKKVNGAFVERTKLATSTYKSQDAIVAVSASDPRLEAGGQSGGSGSGGSAGPAEPV